MLSMNIFKNIKNFDKFKGLEKTTKKFFSHGPYNPMNYKRKLVSDKKYTTEETYFIQKKYEEFKNFPVYNMRHVHPIRQSGPIPAYHGDYTMEDVRKNMWYIRAPYDTYHESTDVPGLTRREALRIQSFGLSPYEELDYAYIAVNNGIDVFYEPDNNAYLVRQVVTNSKGEKVECLIPANEGDEFTYLPFSQKAGQERMDHSYDPVPGEPPISPMPDYELGTPYTWFEYESDNRLHSIMVHDQQFPPENERPFDQGKNPHCTKDYWRPQQDIKQGEELENPNWYPKTHYNVYNRSDFKGEKTDFTDEREK